MKIFRVIMVMALIVILNQQATGQLRVEYETIGRSSLTDYWGNKYGSGDMNKVSLQLGLPVAKKLNIGCYADYITMNNNGTAKEINDNRIVNLGVNIGHHRQLSERWSILTTFGGGIFAPANEVRLKSILGSCGAIFIRRLNSNVELGGGIGISNVYGAPMVLPMIYLNWHRNGKFDFNINIADGINVGATMKSSKRFELNLTALNISGISAVREREGKSRIYSQLCVSSSLTPTFIMSKRMNVYVGIGGSWARSVSESDRTLKAFFKGFGEEHRSKDFGSALRLNAGVKLKF